MSVCHKIFVPRSEGGGGDLFALTSGDAARVCSAALLEVCCCGPAISCRAIKRLRVASPPVSTFLQKREKMIK